MDRVELGSAKTLSSNEERGINDRIKQLEEIKNEGEIVQGVNYESKDPKAIEAKIAELEKIKREQGAPPLSLKERDRVTHEIKMLTEDLQKDMPTWDDYVGLTPKSGSKYSSLVRKIYNWERDPVRRQKVQRWKMLRRALEPEDPTFSSTMHLFPQ